MKKMIILLTLGFSVNVMAAGDGEYSAADLIPAAVNVILLASLIVYKLRGKASAFFTEKSESVSQLMDKASSMAKEAELMMEEQKKKMSSLDSEIESMKTDSTKSISDFEKVYSEEVTTRIQTLKEDAAQKIDAEKSEMINELNSNLLDLVISNAKSQIKSNPELAKNASSKMVEGL